MKKYRYILTAYMLVLIWDFTSCSNDPNEHAAHNVQQQDEHAAHNQHGEHKAPEVKNDVNSNEASANTIQIADDRQALANIKTDTVKMGTINDGLTLLGTTAYNENRTSVITARSKGRIDKLVKRNPGDMINKGDLLYTLYSEELLAAEKEYLTALDQEDKYGKDKTVESLLHASRERLLLAGVTVGQLEELEKKRTVQSSIPFYSEDAGAITSINVKEGAYVEVGTVLYSLADLSTLWINAQLYSNEIHRTDDTHAEAMINGKKYSISVDLISPALEQNSKINIMRFRLDNKDLSLKPGMMASVQLKGKNKQALVIPKSALLAGKMAVVWVKKGPELFESRMVKTGMETKNSIEITGGLNAGDIIVTSGAYLVNSEFILKKGATAQHQHAH